MSNGVNKVFLLGNLGADPELKQTNGGDAVLKLRLATSRTYLDRNQAKQERTEWHSVVIWGKRAAALARFLSKGSRVHIEGELRYSSYEATDGSGKRYITDIIAREITLLGDASGGSRRGDASEPDMSGTYEGGGGDDDIPF